MLILHMQQQTQISIKYSHSTLHLLKNYKKNLFPSSCSFITLSRIIITSHHRCSNVHILILFSSYTTSSDNESEAMRFKKTGILLKKNIFYNSAENSSQIVLPFVYKFSSFLVHYVQNSY